MAGRIINFAEATREMVLEGLEDALKLRQGYSPLEISYTLFRRAVGSGVGEIVSPLRINRKADNPSPGRNYVHILTKGSLRFCCYTSCPIDINGNFIDPSQLPASST